MELLLLFIQIVMFSCLLTKTEKFKMLKTGLSHDGKTEKLVLRRILGPKREKQKADGIIYSYFFSNIMRMMKYHIDPNIRLLFVIFTIFVLFILYVT